jgi:hypothetical protein
MRRPRGLLSISSGMQATYQAFFGNMNAFQGCTAAAA